MIFKFGQFEFDKRKRELRRGSELRSVEPQVFNLLAFLIENRGRIVTRDELFDAVWHKRIVSDSVLGSRINAARRAVDDDGKQQKVIRTLRKNGVRFVAAVVEEGNENGAALNVARVHRAAFDLSGAPSLVMPPFAWVDDSARSRFVAAGLTEETKFSLHRVDWLRVVTTQPTFASSNGGRGTKDLARYAVEGSVRTEADQCVVIARLTDTRTGTCLWSEKYFHDPRNLSSNVSNVAAKIAGAVSEQIFAVGESGPGALPSNSEALGTRLSLLCR